LTQLSYSCIPGRACCMEFCQCRCAG